MSKVSSFVLKEFEISYLPQLRRLREICYGEFDVSDFAKYQKNNPELVWIISSIHAPNHSSRLCGQDTAGFIENGFGIFEMIIMTERNGHNHIFDRSFFSRNSHT